jgi:hypothetical protein
MTDSTLHHFQAIAEEMAGAPTNWQWIGKFQSQRHFGITKAKAEDYARRFGGEAKEMESLDPRPEYLDGKWVGKGLY